MRITTKLAPLNGVLSAAIVAPPTGCGMECVRITTKLAPPNGVLSAAIVAPPTGCGMECVRITTKLAAANGYYLQLLHHLWGAGWNVCV
jgi:hypothetical protein